MGWQVGWRAPRQLAHRRLRSLVGSLRAPQGTGRDLVSVFRAWVGMQAHARAPRAIHVVMFVTEHVCVCSAGACGSEGWSVQWTAVGATFPHPMRLARGRQTSRAGPDRDWARVSLDIDGDGRPEILQGVWENQASFATFREAVCAWNEDAAWASAHSPRMTRVAGSPGASIRIRAQQREPELMNATHAQALSHSRCTGRLAAMHSPRACVVILAAASAS